VQRDGSFSLPVDFPSSSPKSILPLTVDSGLCAHPTSIGTWSKREERIFFWASLSFSLGRSGSRGDGLFFSLCFGKLALSGNCSFVGCAFSRAVPRTSTLFSRVKAPERSGKKQTRLLQEVVVAVAVAVDGGAGGVANGSAMALCGKLLKTVLPAADDASLSADGVEM